MSLTTSDLDQLRIIIQEETRTVVQEETRAIVQEETRAVIQEETKAIVSGELSRELDPIKSELKAIRNDIKDIYTMIARLQSGFVTDPEFQKLSIEKKLLQLNAELLAAAKQADITLPRP